MSSAQRRHCPPSTAWRPVSRSSIFRLNGSRANPPGGARTRCMQKRAPSRAHGRALPCRAAPGLGTSGTGSRSPDRPSRASWPRPVPPEQPRRLERVAARARPAQRRLPSSRRRLSGRVVGKTGCRLTPGRASRCWRVGYGRTLVRRLGSAGGWHALSTSAHRRVVRPRPSSARRSAGRLAYAAAIKLDSVLADADRQPRSVGLRSVAWMAELLARCATCASEATKRRGRDLDFVERALMYHA